MESARSSWKSAFAFYAQWKTAVMFLLGFSAGLPFLLVFSTLTARLTEEGLSRSVIGFFSWIGITYSVKVFWAPIVDHVRLPILSKLGQRRSWMLLAQLGVISGLAAMALSRPETGLTAIAVCAILVAFSSATQDVAIDAYRIETADNIYQAAMSAAYIFGYRVALLVAGAGSFYIAEYASWTHAYLMMSALGCIGLITTLSIREPIHQQPRGLNLKIPPQKQATCHRWIRLFKTWFNHAIVAPFTTFFKHQGPMAIAILMLIATYRMSDITMGVMANPFYLDLGFSKLDIANISKIFGFFMSIAGAGFGGVLVIRYGIKKPLIAGAILVAATNLLFVKLTYTGTDLFWLTVAISADNLSGGLASAVFIAYLSSLTQTSHTATQYALFSSLMTLPAKLIGGYSGIIVDAYHYPVFFMYTALLGLPAILLALAIKHKGHQGI